MKDLKFIHYSNQIIKNLEDKQYDQNEKPWQAKPVGLWFSVEGKKTGINWKELCEEEKFRIDSLQHEYEITFKPDANLLHLKTEKEILYFSKKYSFKTMECDHEYDTHQLQWDKVKSDYQGIIISPYQWNCRFSLKTSWYYGWDCSSGCVWDLSCIEKFEPIAEKKGKK